MTESGCDTSEWRVGCTPCKCYPEHNTFIPNHREEARLLLRHREETAGRRDDPDFEGQRPWREVFRILPSLHSV